MRSVTVPAQASTNHAESGCFPPQDVLSVKEIGRFAQKCVGNVHCWPHNASIKLKVGETVATGQHIKSDRPSCWLGTFAADSSLDLSSLSLQGRFLNARFSVHQSDG